MNFETRNFVPAPWAHPCVSSTVQQSVLSPEVSVLHQPGSVCPASACALPVRICSTAACAVPEDGLQHAACGAPGLSVYESQCCTETCLSTRAFVCTWGVYQIYGACAALMRVCLQELLCAPEVSVDYIEPVLHLFLSVYNLCITWKCLSSRACAAFVHFCLPELCSASVLVWSLQERWVI